MTTSERLAEIEATLLHVGETGDACVSDMRFLLALVKKQRAALEVAKEALDGFQLSHEHNENNAEYRPLSDTRGWCSVCTEKVGLNEDFARDALAEISRILEGGK